MYRFLFGSCLYNVNDSYVGLMIPPMSEKILFKNDLLRVPVCDAICCYWGEGGLVHRTALN